MAHSVTHTFVSPVADDSDPNEVGPEEWNAAHTVTLDADELLTSIKTVDGTGSGLDADTVDGSEAAALLARANHTGTQTLSTISDAGTLAGLDDLSTFDTGDLSEGSNLYFTDERAQDAVGTILVDSSEIDFTYNDGTPSITAALVAGSIDESKLDTSVNASLDLADSAVQPAAIANMLETSDIGTSVQAWDAQLDSLSSASANGVSLVTAANYAAMRGLLDLEIGTDVQAYSADLADLVTRWVPASASGPASLDFLEDTDNGSNKVTVTAPASLAADRTQTYQDASGIFALTDNLGMAFSVGSNALTAAIKQQDGATDATSSSPVHVLMRSSTASSGALIRRTVTGALSLTVPSGATLGHVDGIASVLYWYLIDNSGTLELAVSFKYFGQTGIVSTTTMGTGSDSGTVMYSATGRSNVPFRLIGRTIDTQTTAGTWAAAPSEVRAGQVERQIARFQADKNSSDQGSISSATDTKLTMTNEVYDEGGYYDSTNSRWRPPPGLVRIQVSVQISAGFVDQGEVKALILKNGSAYRAGFMSVSGASSWPVGVLEVYEQADGDDYYEAGVNVSGAGDKTANGSTLFTFFVGEVINEN